MTASGSHGYDFIRRKGISVCNDISPIAMHWNTQPIDTKNVLCKHSKFGNSQAMIPLEQQQEFVKVSPSHFLSNRTHLLKPLYDLGMS